MADITETTVVGESSLIPYMRRQDIAFDANNLRPRKLARIFFDEIVMNGFAQRGNKITLNSKKVLVVTPNNTYTYAAGDTLYQGASNLSTTFTATVDGYTSGNTTLVISGMSGNFDADANVFIERSNGLTQITADVGRVTNSNTADVFVLNEGLYSTNNKIFMKCIGSSGENLLYVSENFINANIAPVGGNTLAGSVFNTGDLVYQTAAGTSRFDLAIFVGKVEYIDKTNGTIAISATSGALNVNTTTTNAVSRLWNASNTATQPLCVRYELEANLAAGHVIVSTANTSKRVSILSHEHNSGMIANTKSTQANVVYLNSSDNSVAVGNVMYFTSGTGLGQFRRVTAKNGREVELASDLLVTPTSNTKYSIGNFVVDENGSLNGILNVPEEPNFKFKTGERVLTITDVDTLTSDDYTMKASAKFSSGGMRNQMQRINLTPVMKPLPEFVPTAPVAPPPPTQRPATPVPAQTPVVGTPRSTIPKRPIRDPVAQTFWTPKPEDNKTSSGVFVSSVELFFGAKPSLAKASLQLPIQVKIAEVVNGFPTQNFLAEATVKCKDVKTSLAPSVNDTDTITKFTFRDPVYLQPDTEYALVVVSDSPEYEVYVAELGGNVLGADPPQRISEQPYAGSFFRSQNSSTWTPYQNEDLMFVINKAVFNSTGSAVLQIADSVDWEQEIDRLFLNADLLAFPTGTVDFKVKGVFSSNGAFDNYNSVRPQQVFKYGDLLDASNKAGSANFGNARRLAVGNANSLQILAEFVTSDTDVSPVFNKETVSIIVGEHYINNAGISNSEISIVNRGNGYNAIVTSGNAIFGSSNNTLNTAAQLFRETYLANNFNIGFYSITIGGEYGSGAQGFAVANTTGANTVDFIVIDAEGSGYIETPNVSIVSGNAASGAVDARLTVQGETGPRGGNMLCKYITRQITLEDGFEAEDLRVFMDTVRPNGTDIQVYYKVLGQDDPDRFSDKSWVRMHKMKDTKSKDSQQMISLEFRPDVLENTLKYTENGRQYPIGGKFKYFAVKVCLLAADTTVAPYVQNLRIIATPGG